MEYRKKIILDKNKYSKDKKIKTIPIILNKKKLSIRMTDDFIINLTQKKSHLSNKYKQINLPALNYHLIDNNDNKKSMPDDKTKLIDVITKKKLKQKTSNIHEKFYDGDSSPMWGVNIQDNFDEFINDVEGQIRETETIVLSLPIHTIIEDMSILEFIDPNIHENVGKAFELASLNFTNNNHDDDDKIKILDTDEKENTPKQCTNME